MRLFLSGMNSAQRQVQEVALANNANILLSYFHHIKKNPAVISNFWKPCGLFIDSGGFSVRTHGAEIPIKDYRDFLLALKGSFIGCVNLDTLNLEESEHNIRILEASGLKPLPVYHITEWLDRSTRGVIERWCKEYPYIAVSGIVPAQFAEKFHGLIFEHAIKNKTKVHALTGTTQKLLEKFPFYSADSTSWKASDRFGWIWSFDNGSLSFEFGLKRYKKQRDKGVKWATDPRIFSDKFLRMQKSVEAWLKFEKHLTEYWKRRGVEWHD